MFPCINFNIFSLFRYAIIELKNNSKNDISGQLKFNFKNDDISEESLAAVFENDKPEYSLSIRAGENVRIKGFYNLYSPK